MALWFAIAALALMIVSGVIGFRGEPTASTAIARILFAVFMITFVASIAIYAQ
jgi:uncharacterized membrane protein YtjA (UPF0391 family)